MAWVSSFENIEPSVRGRSPVNAWLMEVMMTRECPETVAGLVLQQTYAAPLGLDNVRRGATTDDHKEAVGKGG
jgi:hypothetical protein